MIPGFFEACGSDMVSTLERDVNWRFLWVREIGLEMILRFAMSTTLVLVSIRWNSKFESVQSYWMRCYRSFQKAVRTRFLVM